MVRRTARSTTAHSAIEHERDVEVLSWGEVAPTYRQEWERRSGSSGHQWQDIEPYCRFGYEMAHDPFYGGRDWRDVQGELQGQCPAWSRRHNYRHEESAWAGFRDYVRAAFEEARARVGRR